ncbi:serine/threonine-protein phosphatase 4 regulatory subunit 4 [Patella vulgata]|uniref:serine/threonine-protein phosphatase 4 regulatory subunit 4 n=1 Tax=Patella vulgata TaxID=6465 RepID=UPI00217F5E37|nr:serine/threonine-protein phosphatase 4 regulatory subunit 4 [Patella vulgata]
MDATSTSLAEDLQELQLERVIPRSLKTNEELDRLTVDEHLSDIERAVYLLSSGQDVQRICVISNLPDLIKNNNDECMRRVVPKVREVLHVAQTEMQLAASSAFLQILQQQIVPIQNYTQTFLQTILTSVESKDPDCANAWLETLLDVIDLLPKDVIKKEILGIAIAKGQLSQSVQARLACCRILGKVSTKFESFVIKKEILPVVQSLCQDVDYEVRGCMCQQLDPVARGLGLEATKSAILPELVELTNDEESYVRIIGLETVVNILTLLDNEICIYTIIPLVCKFCQQAIHSQDSTLPVIAKQLGKLCHGLWDKLTEDKKGWFLDQYRSLCRVGLEKSRSIDKDCPSKTDVSDLFDEEDKKVECRKNCSYNFPSMALLVGAKCFKIELHSTFVALCKDPHVLVRKKMAASFHEVAHILSSSAHTLQNELSLMLKDESIEVLRYIIMHLPETLDILSKGDSKTVTEARMNALSEIIPAILSAEIVVFASNDWRLQESLMKSLSCLPACCNSEDIYCKVIPVLFQKLKTSRAIPVRHAAAQTTLVLIRQLRKLEQREQLIHRLVSDFCHGKSCHHRSLFIDMCYFFIELFSKSFFKDHLFDYVLELTSDPVANVRLRMCFMLPSLKRQVKLPYDRNHLQLLEAAVRKILINEKDRDVNVAIKSAVEELDGIHVQMESIMSRRKNFEEDTEDQIKEEEEKQLIIMEEQDRKEEEQKAKLEKKGSSNSKIPAPKKAAPKSGTSSKGDYNRDFKKASSLPTAGGISSTSTKALSGGNKLTKPAAKSASALTPSATFSRKGSGSGVSSTSIASTLTSRRGSLTSAGSNSDTKSKSKVGNSTNGLNTGTKSRKTSK